MKFPKVIGLCGVARSGKDTFCETALSLFKEQGLKAHRISFADALKNDVKDFLLDKVGISPFTNKDSEKDVIRDFLVAYGTKLMRKIDQNYWISKVQEQVRTNMENDEISIFTDIRYENEIDWIQEELDGYCIHITRKSPSGNAVPPANPDEEQNDPILYSKSDAQLVWATMEDQDVLRYVVLNELNSLMPALA